MNAEGVTENAESWTIETDEDYLVGNEQSLQMLYLRTQNNRMKNLLCAGLAHSIPESSSLQSNIRRRMEEVPYQRDSG